MTTGPPLLAWPLPELEALVKSLGGRAFHARIAREQLLAQGVTDYASMTALPRALREALADRVPLTAGEERDRSRSKDGTQKLLLAFPAGQGRGGREVLVETVHLPPRDRKSKRGATLCVSTQAGCPVGCPFCASGLDGLARNLEAHEIVEQYVRGRALGPLSRSVVMGIGEPLLNYENFKTALAMVQGEMGLGSRKVTVSTVGFPERLRRVARDRPRFQLAISLHTADDDLRDELVPAMRGVPIEDILEAGEDWFLQTGREVTYEVVLLGGVNDGPDHAQMLARRLAGRRATVNLIPYNPTPGLHYERPTGPAVDAFQASLREAGLVATVRWSRGVDSAAACGQLRLAYGARTDSPRSSAQGSSAPPARREPTARGPVTPTLRTRPRRCATPRARSRGSPI